MTQDVVVVGGPAIGDFAILDGDVTSSVFDNNADTWTLTTRDGQTCHSRVVIASTPFAPWIPDLAGRNDFRGVSFHAAAPDSDFDPAGKRVAVIGADAAAGALIEHLITSAAEVLVFAYPPRRIIADISRARRWLRRHASDNVVRSAIDTIATSGIRTADGVHHDVGAIIYGTGFAIREDMPDGTLVGARGLTIRQAWRDGMEPYHGVAVHGFPNYFMVSGSDSTRYVTRCLELMKGHTRIEVRRSNQQMFNERVNLHRPTRHPARSAFDLSSSARVEDDTYDGPATLTLADTCRQVRVRLSGHVDPIDGQYHWQGTIFSQLSADLLKQAAAATLAVGAQTAPARITEQTPQGTYSIVGVGTPPFALDDVELAVRQI